MRKTAIALTLALIFLLIAGCNKGTDMPESSVTIEQLTEGLDPLFNTAAMAVPELETVTRNLKVDSELFHCNHVQLPVGTNQDEFGVFITHPSKAKQLESQLKAYIERRQEAWMEEYLPEQRNKIFDAEVIVHGDYVLYIIADTDKRQEVKAAFEGLVK